MSENESNKNGQPVPGDSQNEWVARMIQRVAERDAEGHRIRLAFMATQPQSKPCRTHPDCIRLIDETATSKATEYYRQPTAGYTPCTKCTQIAENLELKKHGVPENLIHASFENFLPDGEVEADHVEVVKSFCAKWRGFLIMLGAFGTGKSHLAAAALRVRTNGWFVKHSSLLYALRETYRDKSAFDPIERGQSARLLVLDDVGLSAGGRDELPMLHEILDYRHCEQRPTIITSNLPFDNLAGVLGDRMGDRLRESCFRVLTFTGSSHRREARERYFEPTA
jgi:DNA replication protein DnaC